MPLRVNGLYIACTSARKTFLVSTAEDVSREKPLP
jgi:hypothetical protein